MKKICANRSCPMACLASALIYIMYPLQAYVWSATLDCLSPSRLWRNHQQVDQLPGSSSSYVFFFIACASSLCLFFFFVEEVAEVAFGGAARKLPRRATVVEEVSASTVEVSIVNLTFFCCSVVGDGEKRCRKSLGALRIK